jgi:hypothetical protein
MTHRAQMAVSIAGPRMPTMPNPVATRVSRSRARPAPTTADCASEQPTATRPIEASSVGQDGRSTGPLRSGGGPEDQPRSGRVQGCTRVCRQHRRCCRQTPQARRVPGGQSLPRTRSGDPWRARSRGVLSFGYFSLDKQRKVTRRPRSGLRKLLLSGPLSTTAPSGRARSCSCCNSEHSMSVTRRNPGSRPAASTAPARSRHRSSRPPWWSSAASRCRSR